MARKMILVSSPIRKNAKTGVATLTRETTIERVVQRFEDLVRSGQLKRGSRLPAEPKLAEMLGVSRTSLREALKGLVFLGLLRARAGDGTYLRPSLNSMASRHLQWMLLLEEVQYLELYELRQILEPVVAQLAARRATAADLDAMRNALAGMKRSIRHPEAFIRHEMEFHGAITRASRNRAIESMMQMMYGALSEGKHRVLPLVADLAGHCERHEHIFELIAGGDAARARQAIASDVRYAKSLLDRSLTAKKPEAARKQATRAGGTRPSEAAGTRAKTKRSKNANPS
jgi:GntR family transcriptional regulator, transcriptional repressor for pyruvate dehydrogenase complex